MTARYHAGFSALTCLAMRESSQPVWTSFPTKSGDWIISEAESTIVRISPRILTSLRATTIERIAASRVSPLANRWPNCESENSWMPPPDLTEK